MAKKKTSESFVNPFTEGVSYDEFLNAIPEGVTVEDYLKDELSEKEIEIIKNELVIHRNYSKQKEENNQ